MIRDFSQRVQVVSKSLPDDFGFGGGVATETTLFETWASIKQVSRESAVRQGLDAETQQYRMRIRYVPEREFTKDHFIKWNGAEYKAVTSPSVIEIDKKKFLESIIVKQGGQ